jgi:hypothetical protein
MRTLQVFALLCASACWLSCTALGRPLQDRCYVYIEDEDICVQHGGQVVRHWSDLHPWEDGRQRFFYVYVSASGTAWEMLGR